MPIRNQAKVSTASLVPGIRLDLNPFSQRVGTARLLRNYIPERNRMIRKPYAPPFQVAASSSSVWHIVDFRYHRANAPESQMLVFRADGKIYRRTGGSELEIFPGNTTFAVLNNKPCPVQLGNKLFFSDLSSAYVYDGRSFRAWGIARPTSAPVVSVQAGPGVTAANGLSGSFTWVVLDENGNRVHESSRSTASAFSAALSNQVFRLDITGITPPAGVTHWSGYTSDLNASNIRRRVNTTRITTLTFDVTTLPAGTAAIEPIRNDPPGVSIVMGGWRNRIAMRQETDKRNIWFTAFGEVSSTNAGAPDESVCGRDSSTISDLSNEFSFPAYATRLILQHEGILHCFTEDKGFVLIGSGGVLDNVGSRELQSLQQFTEGAAGPNAGASTPYGLAWLTMGRKVNLWYGGERMIDIGDSLKPQLDTIPESSLVNVYMFWWDGNGRRWLCMVCNCADSDNLTGAVSQRMFVYDFSLGTEAERPGEWFEWTDQLYTCVGGYTDGDQRFLLGGASNGNVYQLDTICNPSHLNRSMVLGKTYLGSAIQNNPASTMRTGLMIPNNDRWATGLYVGFNRGSQDGASTTVGSSPVVKSAIDTENPDVAPAITLTPGSANTSGEYRAWLLPESGGVEGGALAKQFQLEASYAAGSSNNAEADGRLTVALEALYKLAFSWQVGGDLNK